MKQTKKVTSQTIIGQLGANLIEKIVLNMEYVWRATSIFDVGIDGEIEIRVPTTGEMTNLIIKLVFLKIAQISMFISVLLVFVHENAC